MKPLVRLGLPCIRRPFSYPSQTTCIRIKAQCQFIRGFATQPPIPPPSESEQPNANDSSSEQSSDVPTTHDPPSPPKKHPQAYQSPPNEPRERVFRPITSEDWTLAEHRIPPVPETNWFDSPTDSPVPLNKDFPLTHADYETLPSSEKYRLTYDAWRKDQLEFIRKNKLNDQNHLHPIGEPFKMPMVAYHRGYAPEGTTPPPVQKIPWQLRRPWNWIRWSGLGLVVGGLAALAVVFAMQHSDELTLRRLESKEPAPRGWNEKAKAYYAVALRHREQGEMQHAAWAMQRALVEAGYRWVIDGKTDDEEPKK